MKRKLLFFIKLSFSIIIIYLLVSKFDAKDYLNTIKNSDIFYILLALISFFSLIFTQAIRLHILIDNFSKNIFHTLKLILISFFFNNILPTNIGGDSYKIYSVKKKKTSWGNSFTLVAIDRITALTVIIISGFLSIIINFSNLKYFFKDNNILLNYKFIFIILFLLPIVSLFIIYFVKKKSINILFQTKKFILNAIKTIKSINKIQYFSIILFSIFTLIFRIFKFYFIILAFKENIDISQLIIVIFFSNLISLIPISFSGLGLQEGTLFYGLTFFGIGEINAISIALTNRVLAVFLAFIDFIIFFISNKFLKQNK